MPGETPLDSDTEDTYGAYVDALGKFGLLYVDTIEGVTQKSRESDDLGSERASEIHRGRSAYLRRRCSDRGAWPCR